MKMMIPYRSKHILGGYTMKNDYKYTINNMQKRNYEEVHIGLKWGMLVLVTLVCIVLYVFVDLG